MRIGPLPAPLERIRAAMDRRLERIAASRAGRRLDPFLGFTELRRLDPILALVPVTLLLIFGLMRSQFGHMDTVPGIFPIMALISGLNPVTGILSGLAYGAGDLVQKFVTDDVFYEGIRTAGDYWGARAGYVIAYSGLIGFAVLPGVASRVGRVIAVRVAAGQRGGTGGGPDPPSLGEQASRVASVIGSVVGAVAGTLAATVFWKPAVASAFLLRPSPDNSCFALSGSNVIDAIPPASVGGGVGGGGSALASPTAGGVPALGSPMAGGFPVAPVAGQVAPPIPGGAGPALGGGPAPASGGSPPGAAAPPAPAPPVETEGVVVSGPEAIVELVNSGHLKPIVHGGKIYVKPPTDVGGVIAGIGYGEPITLPTGEKVLDPNNVVIVKNVPVRTGPTTTAEGSAAVGAMINEGFPTHTDPATGRVFVKYPPNLIHGNVTGIAVEGTTMVGGVEVIDPTKSVIVMQTGASTPQPPVVTTAPPVPPQPPVVPAGPPQPPVVNVVPPGPPQPPVVKVVPPTPPTPPVQPPPQPDAQPQPPPRTPTDAKSLTDSLTKPGTTVITPANVPAFAPDVLTPDGRIKVTDPKAPPLIKKLEGVKAPTPVIQNGTVSVDLPMNLGEVRVKLKVEGGRLVGETTTKGTIKRLEDLAGGMELMFSDPNAPPKPPSLDVGRSVQSRIDRYNKLISDARPPIEVKSVTAEGGQIKVVTGPKS